MLSRYEADSQAGRRGRRDTVTDTVETVIGSHSRSPHTVKGALEPRLPPRAREHDGLHR